MATMETTLSQTEVDIENKKRTIERLEQEISHLKLQLRDHVTLLKQNVVVPQNTSSSFLQSLVEGSSMGTIKALKKENKQLREQVIILLEIITIIYMD